MIFVGCFIDWPWRGAVAEACGRAYFSDGGISVWGTFPKS